MKKINRLSIAIFSLTAAAIVTIGCQKERVPIDPTDVFQEKFGDTTYITDIEITIEDPVLRPEDTVQIGG